MEDDISSSQHPFLRFSKAVPPRPPPPPVLMTLEEPLLNAPQATRQLSFTDMFIDLQLLLVQKIDCADSGSEKQPERGVCEGHE